MKTPFAATSLDELRAMGFAVLPSQPSRIPQPIVPAIVATSVLQEASIYLAHPLPIEWADILVQHAEAICERNAHFRRKLNGKGDTGRDRLWSFMRHWLCAMIAEKFPDLHRRLPSGYNVGHELTKPPIPSVAPIAPSTRRVTKPRSPQKLIRIHGLLPEPV